MIHLFGEDKLRAVAYYRHSAEDKQENSVGIQREQVENFAVKEGVEILEHFQDEGFTGTNADRPGFQEMFNKWVRNSGAPRIDYVLVYDASRFGRFQSTPEALRLLVECDERGINLATVNRGLPRKETSVMDYLILILDFAQAGEYSKLLSDKVTHGCIKVSEQGYSAGGTAPYGYVRVLLSETRERLEVLHPGQWKVIANQRVSFEPSMDGEAETVERIFKEFVTKGLFPEEIADGLNQSKLLTAKSKKWTTSRVTKILANETYMGTRVYNKVSSRLNQEKRRNSPDEWTRCLNAHKAIVDELMFRKAQERLYWLRPASRGQASRKFRLTQSYVWRYIDAILQSFNEDQQYYVRRNLPVVFGSTYLVNDEKRSCFYIPTEAKKFGKLFVVSVDSTAAKPSVDGINLIDMQEIGWSSYFILSQNDDQPTVALADLGTELQKVSGAVIVQLSPWLNTVPELVTSSQATA